MFIRSALATGREAIRMLTSPCRQSSALMLLVLSLATFPPSGQAACFDFGDGVLGGWNESNSGGAATFNVVDRNASGRAHVRHVSGTAAGDESSLSRTFDYVPTDVVSFEMEAAAFLSGSRHGLAGAQVSFLNAFSVPIGAAGLFNVTSPSLLGANDSEVPSTQESYSATMAEFAELAGLDESADIAKMRLSFAARGSFSFGGNVVPNRRSGGDVWFDNVCVGTTPDAPAADLTCTTDDRFQLVNKVSDGDRWMLAREISTGRIVANVFDPTQPQDLYFFDCELQGGDVADLFFSCRVSLNGEPWTSEGLDEVRLARSFLGTGCE